MQDGSVDAAGAETRHPIARLPREGLSASTLRLRIYSSAAEELDRTSGADVPRWIERLYLSHGEDPGRPSVASAMEALAEGLHHRLSGLTLVVRKAERRGWRCVVEDNLLLIYTGLPDAAVREAMEADGVWALVQRYAIGPQEPDDL